MASPSRGVVAAGHPLTAEAGAEALRAGGNAIDAAVAAVLCSLVTESPLTGLGAGGFMLIHHAGEDALLDFFVAAPGFGDLERRSELVPVAIDFGGAEQVFNVGEASCGVPGMPAGLQAALERFGSMPLGELAAPAIAHARHGVEVNEQQAYLHELLGPILVRDPIGLDLYAPGGRPLRAGEVLRNPELAEALERYTSEGPEPWYEGEIAAAISERVQAGGGTLAREDLAGYEVELRDPVRASYAGAEILTNPPPSAGGVLIAFALDVLDRLDSRSLEDVVAAMAEAQAARTEDFHEGLYRSGFAEEFLGAAALERAAGAARAERSGDDPVDRLGSTTHISVVDAEGAAAAVTCSNGSGSGVYVAGTGVHVNNMLGEEDLNPLGFHRVDAGRRVPSMMSPTLVLRDGEVLAALGSGGSNRIRSAVFQTIVRLVADGLDPQDAVEAPRVHFESGVVQAEPGADSGSLERLADRGYEIARWSAPNLYFGGVHAVSRDLATGGLAGGGDPRRGGAVVVA